MSHLFKRLDDRANTWAQLAEPIIIALGSAGLTGGAMAAAGVLAGKVMRRS